MRQVFKILSINISAHKGEKKRPVARALFKENFGIQGDAHAASWHRQVSLLADEDIQGMREDHQGVELSYGDFAENITTRGVELSTLPIGTRLYLGEVIMEVTQIGKECHHGCAISRAVGDCVMPRRGIFARVLKGGELSPASRCYYHL